MSSAMIMTVFRELDIERYLLDPQCGKNAGVYENAVRGWNSGMTSCTLCHVAFLVFRPGPGCSKHL